MKRDFGCYYEYFGKHKVRRRVSAFDASFTGEEGKQRNRLCLKHTYCVNAIVWKMVMF